MTYKKIRQLLGLKCPACLLNLRGTPSSRIHLTRFTCLMKRLSIAKSNNFAAWEKATSRNIKSNMKSLKRLQSLKLMTSLYPKMILPLRTKLRPKLRRSMT